MINGLRRRARAWVPLNWRRQVALAARKWQDLNSGVLFASQKLPSDRLSDWIERARVTQPVRDAPHVEQKRHNLAKACALLEGFVIAPGETFSFWLAVGEPSARLGWQAGRTIINDIMTTDPGGGLCQISGLIHHVGLLAGMVPVERHAHSTDIHVTDETRFTPLGLDATIVHGFKDLRMANTGAGALALSFQCTRDSLTATILSPVEGPCARMEISREDGAGWREARVRRHWPDGRAEFIATTRYSLPA